MVICRGAPSLLCRPLSLPLTIKRYPHRPKEDGPWNFLSWLSRSRTTAIGRSVRACCPLRETVLHCYPPHRVRVREYLWSAPRTSQVDSTTCVAAHRYSKA